MVIFHGYVKLPEGNVKPSGSLRAHFLSSVSIHIPRLMNCVRGSPSKSHRCSWEWPPKQTQRCFFAHLLPTIFVWCWPASEVSQFWTYMDIWLVVSNMNFIFHFIYGMSSFPLTNSIIFQDGYCTTYQEYHIDIIIYQCHEKPMLLEL